MIFLASLTAAINNSSEPDAVFISKLNKIMNLSNSGDNALKLPIYVNGLIWKHKEYIQRDLDVLRSPFTDNVMKQQCLGRIGTFIPVWIKYADSQTIMDDLNKLFQPSNQFFSMHR